MRLNFRIRHLGGLLLLALPLVTAAQATSGKWRDTLERISTGVVSIKVDSTRAFDTEWNQSGQATGFVVDAERGLILTNRHVVTSGPVRAEALFLNQEEVELTPVYRDPVHDFGFFRYDPSKLRYIQPAQLRLNPAGAEVGREIRVVGNDAGEQLSILSGTIARLRRQAPDYGAGKYNDFNTFYLQAASGTSGGSSGSPVIDIGGEVVALNAGGASKAASSFFLPLDRVQRSLELLQRGEPVSRGTLTTVFVHKAFDELRRLGLDEAIEAEVRSSIPDQTGMLVVDQVIPGTEAEGRLQVGDILIRVNGKLVTDFVPLANLLDAQVGQRVSIELQRNGSFVVEALPVNDLHAVTPAEYLQFADALVHDLSYQQARHLNREIEGVYVANPGYALGSAAIPRGSVIVAIDEQPVANLDDFEAVLAGLADGERTSVRFFSFEDPSASKLRVMRMDRRWFPAQRCRRDDLTGLWPCLALAEGPPPAPPEGGSARLFRNKDAQVRAVERSLVLTTFDMPYTVSGVSERHYYGTGTVVDAERGYVVVDRNTVPEAMGDVFLTFGGELEIPARVAYVHPIHNLTLLQYDPALIGDTPVRAAQPGPAGAGAGRRALGGGPARRQQAGLPDHGSRIRRSYFAAFVAHDAFSRYQPGNPVAGQWADRYRWCDRRSQGSRRIALVELCLPGWRRAEPGKQGRARGAGAGTAEPGRDNLGLYSLETEWRQMPLSAARKFGMSDEQVRRLADHDPERRQALAVVRTVAGTPAADLLQPGDILLSVNGASVTRFREVERAVQQPRVSLELLRNGEVAAFDIDTVLLDGGGVRRAVLWAGALLQAPYRDMAAQRGVPPEGVYVAYFAYGSPASRYGLFAGRRIVAVDGEATSDLDVFLGQVRQRQDRDAVRLTTVSWNDTVEVLTLKLDQTYWPAYEVRYQDGGWQRLDAP